MSVLVITSLVPSWLNSSFGIDIKLTLMCEAVCLGTSFLLYLVAFLRFVRAVKKETGTYRFIPVFLSQILAEDDK